MDSFLVDEKQNENKTKQNKNQNEKTKEKGKGKRTLSISKNTQFENATQIHLQIDTYFLSLFSRENFLIQKLYSVEQNWSGTTNYYRCDRA